jgi:hypothetical protein
MPVWITYAQALGTPLAALVAAAITGGLAYRQWWTAHNRLKLDLFQQRLAVYLAAQNLIGAVLARGHASNEEIYSFAVETNVAKWLFDTDIARYLDGELRGRAQELLRVQSLMKRCEISEVVGVNEERRLLNWFEKQYGHADMIFGPYLKLSH